MEIFFSAVKKVEILDQLIDLGARNFLFSYEDKKVLKMIEYLNERQERFMILIDSGAFSAWNRGLIINREDYLDFMKKVKKINLKDEIIFVNLDVIPHKKGTTPTEKQIKEAVDKGFDNYFFFKEKGYSTMHIFHQFEEFKILDRIINECNDFNYIGISPANDQSLESRNKWLTQVFRKTRNNVRTHLFGLTAKQSLELFPAFSADSSSWLNIKKYGELFNYDELEKLPKKKLSRGNALYYDNEMTHYDVFRYYLNLQHYITKLWQKRGVSWFH